MSVISRSEVYFLPLFDEICTFYSRVFGILAGKWKPVLWTVHHYSMTVCSYWGIILNSNIISDVIKLLRNNKALINDSEKCDISVLESTEFQIFQFRVREF
jgi:hypothetical protein